MSMPLILLLVIVIGLTLYSIIFPRLFVPDSEIKAIPVRENNLDFISLKSSVFSKDSVKKTYTMLFKGNQLEISYRRHVPEGAGYHYPSPLFLHGPGELDTGNNLHMTKNVGMLDALIKTYYQKYLCYPYKGRSNYENNISCR